MRTALTLVPTNEELGRPNAPQVSPVELAAIQRGLRNLVVHSTDKFNGAFSFTCQAIYAAAILDEFSSSSSGSQPDFVVEDCFVTTIMDRIERKLHAIGLSLAPRARRMPTLSLLAKMHKELPSWRPLTNSSKVATTEASKWLHILHLAIFKALYKKWNVDTAPLGDIPIWNINSSSGAVSILNLFNASRTNVQHNAIPGPPAYAYDFGKLYPSINQDDCQAQANKALAVLWYGRSPDAILRLYFDGRFEWESGSASCTPIDTRQGTANGFKVFSVDFYSAKGLVDIVLREAYVQATSDTILRQTGGIPMGGNAGPDLTNCYLFMYELAFFIRLAQAANIDTSTTSSIRRRDGRRVVHTVGRNQGIIYEGVRQQARNLANLVKFSCRYLDDLLTFNNNTLARIISSTQPAVFVSDPNYPNDTRTVPFFNWTMEGEPVSIGIYGLYPSGLKLTLASGKDISQGTSYLDMLIARYNGTSGAFCTLFYNK